MFSDAKSPAPAYAGAGDFASETNSLAAAGEDGRHAKGRHPIR